MENSIGVSAPHTEQWLGKPSGVREEMVIREFLFTLSRRISKGWG